LAIDLCGIFSIFGSIRGISRMSTTDHGNERIGAMVIPNFFITKIMRVAWENSYAIQATHISNQA